MRPTRTDRRLLPALLLLLLAGLLAGCSGPSAVSVARAEPARSAAPPVFTVTALGDSFTQGFSSCGRPGDCPTYSWATGDEPRVDSLLQRLARARGALPVAHNLSVSGARVGALTRQATRALPTAPDLVVVLIGLNDVCTGSTARMTTPEEFGRQLGRALSVLDEGLPGVPLLLLSVPDPGRTAVLGERVPAARAGWARHTVCPPVFAPGADRPAAAARRAAFDRHLALACRLRPRCTWDGGRVARYRYGAGFLSPDWFHPSAAGPRALADLAEQALVGPAGVEPALGRT